MLTNAEMVVAAQHGRLIRQESAPSETPTMTKQLTLQTFAQVKQIVS